jgi:hypothetical protein
MGQDVPTLLEVREGRRPRVITDVKMRGELIISKTIDTSFGRLELIWRGNHECAINGRIYPHGELERDGAKVRCLLLDYRKTGDRMLDIALIPEDRKQVAEKARFSPKDMMFKAADFGVELGSLKALEPKHRTGTRFYFNVENDSSFRD